MCNCDNACDLNRDDEYYNCYIKVDSTLTEFSCKVQLTNSWLGGFISIAVIGACCLCGGCGFLIYRFCCKK